MPKTVHHLLERRVFLGADHRITLVEDERRGARDADLTHLRYLFVDRGQVATMLQGGPSVARVEADPPF